MLGESLILLQRLLFATEAAEVWKYNSKSCVHNIKGIFIYSRAAPLSWMSCWVHCIFVNYIEGAIGSSALCILGNIFEQYQAQEKNSEWSQYEKCVFQRMPICGETWYQSDIMWCGQIFKKICSVTLEPTIPRCVSFQIIA